MNTAIDTDLAPETKLDDGAPPCWPPLAHLIRPEDRPVKKGTIALCGKKLMGIDLPHATHVCKKCLEIEARMFSQ